ncbi:stromal interaction molecule homolog isoform X2 [Ochlerotatus camptorhynchus]|uniref:stromal interaction molecule homolog isoform X2 n=1 Tax=Ochlerotatus camptorhynchus TaxID=644619 RepID=UPI0031E3BD2C
MKPPQFVRAIGSWLPVTLLLLLVVFVSCFGAADDIQPNSRQTYSAQQHQHQQQQHQQHKVPSHQQQQHHDQRGSSSSSNSGSRGDSVGSPAASSAAKADGAGADSSKSSPSGGGGGGGGSSNRMLETRNSYAVLSQAMSQAVHHEFGTYGSGSADGACSADDVDCIAHHDHLGMEAIRSLHQQLDDDDNGDIDLSESDDFLREELKYDSGYEKRHKAFHFNDDMHISVKELWEAWLRSEVHNWTVDQTTEWLAQSVQLPQYVRLFRLHKVTGKVLPRLAVNNMHYVSNVLGIKDPIHKQKIALKAMDAVLFGPPRETGTRWKDLLLVTLLLTAIIGSWYAYQQNKNAKIHLKRMAKDVEGLLKAEVALKDMQKELERARLEQENVDKEKMDLERRLREAPTLSSSNSDLEVQQLKQEIEMLRSELSRAEVEINDHCWTPPQGLQNWLQLTFELENKQHVRKRVLAEKQLMQAREACEKLRKKRSSLVGAFVSTHGKSIDDVDRSIVEARNSLNDVTNDLQERMFRWKHIENMLGFSIVNNNGLSYLENLLYNRNGGGSKSYRSRLSSSQDDLDDDSVQGLYDGICRGGRDDSSASDDGDRGERDTVTFIVGGCPSTTSMQISALNPLNTGIVSPATAAAYLNSNSHLSGGSPAFQHYHSSSSSNNLLNHSGSVSSTTPSSPFSYGGGGSSPLIANQQQQQHHSSMNDSSQSLQDETLISSSNERIVPPRSKKAPIKPPSMAPNSLGKTPMPPPRKSLSSQSLFSMAHSAASSDLAPLESPTLSLPAASAGLSPSSPTGPGLGTSASAVQLQQFTDSGVNGSRQLLQQTAASRDGSVTSSCAIFPSTVNTAGGGGGSSSSPSPIGIGTAVQPELDTYSTDSSTFDEDVKRRRRKLHFPFGKKFSKSKKTQ